MSEVLKQAQTDGQSPCEQDTNFPLPYQKPVLEELGDLRTKTLGVSNSVGESGNEGSRGNLPI